MNRNKKKLSNEYKNRRKLGQFFTSDKLVSYITKIFKIDFCNKSILEPSFGGCSFIKYMVENSENSHITAVDIDKDLCVKYSNIYKNVKFICNDFLAYETNDKFDIVIGNPPFNLKTPFNYYDTTEGFMKKSLTMLKPDGCLYFVMPSTILRNKQYQHLRQFIIDNYQILGIINTSKYEFLGADIETIVIGIKNKRVTKQKYFYLNNGVFNNIDLTINERKSILLKNTNIYNELKKSFASCNINDLFNIYRGSYKLHDGIRGRQINYFGHYLEMSKNGEFFIGLQNIAYRLASNVIQGNIDHINDTITVLEPKSKIDSKELCFISEYLNSSIAYYLLHVNALNGCKLTIHIDKYYIEDIFVPTYDKSFDEYLNYINGIANSEEVVKYRNNYFYRILNISNDDIDEIENMWCYPLFKRKKKYILQGGE